jgi:hypothetical protein
MIEQKMGLTYEEDDVGAALECRPEKDLTRAGGFDDLSDIEKDKANLAMKELRESHIHTLEEKNDKEESETKDNTKD